MSTVSVVRRKKDSTSRDPFGVALADLMHRRGVSYRQLSEATKLLSDDGKGISPTYISQLIAGVHVATPPRIRLISEALRVSPEYFKEYRQHVVAQRAKLLADEIGLPEVLAALDALEARQHGSNPPTDD